jgi:hypothetical protein
VTGSKTEEHNLLAHKIPDKVSGTDYITLLVAAKCRRYYLACFSVHYIINLLTEARGSVVG